MRILFDHGTPAPLIPFLVGHSVTKAKDAGWDRLVNGELLKAAGQAEFQVLVTTDKNMANQQSLKGRAIAIVDAWQFAMAHRAARHVRKIVSAVNVAQPGSYAEVEIPFQ